MLALGQKLGVETVAEGIENPGAFSMLRDLGCGLAQGYLIGRPMRPEQLSDWHTARESSMRVMPA